MSIHGLPLILYKLARDRKLSNIEFLSIKEFDGKLRTDEGFLSATGDLATLTANTGKDMYIARAKITYYANTTTQSATGNEVVLKINNVVVETSKHSYTDGSDMTLPYEFKDIGHKVTTGQIIKLEVITLDTDIDIEGFIECFEEPTGGSPQIPSI